MVRKGNKAAEPRLDSGPDSLHRGRAGWLTVQSYCGVESDSLCHCLQAARSRMTTTNVSAATHRAHRERMALWAETQTATKIILVPTITGWKEAEQQMAFQTDLLLAEPDLNAR